ncbi:MAG: nicotinamide riboside transporter PnuC [Cyanobacteria bacterium RUI128]|nr:nicotinamide riboside transporter PnuC [Cyanobacteria bacterium RUI128]
MNRFYQFVKKELQGWKKTEIIGLAFIFAVVIFNSIVLNDSKIAAISAICGLMYTIIAGKGKISCYLFGLTGSGFYSYLAFVNGLFGNMMLYLCYYVPMQIIGIFKWKKNLKKETNEIYKTKLPAKERILLSIISVLISAISVLILIHFNDTHPYFDGIATALSLVGMYLTVKRCIEQWLVWGGVNLLSLIMWISVIKDGSRTYSTVFMWSVYLFLSVYFYREWLKEIKSE